jgi:hypothetical protein
MTLKRLAITGAIIALLMNNPIVTGVVAICILGPLALRLVITAGYVDRHHYHSRHSEFD